ncbi:unnamed protein product [Peronospora effusa]|uniref:Uncharacterized protein n=1 Tax=Peronospora effusa TaxID=542832 RepID=A0A3M6VN09_9STRA|nr:hypothetical protein DD238_006842 [Peronospora effusa]CAI5713586.1 unnamed protein product [Peronospora effusa]
MRRSRRLRSRENALDTPSIKRHKLIENKEPKQTTAFDTLQRQSWNGFLANKCCFKAPSDFFDVFALALNLRPECPCEAFIETLGIQLCGPFDLLAASEQKEVTIDKPLYLHGRFFFDPPEIITVMMDNDSDVGRHWGYFRDVPDQVPEYVVCAETSRECKFDIVSTSLFHVLKSRLEKRGSALGTGGAAGLLEKIKAYCDENACTGGQSEAALRTKRAKESVAASLHQLGIVVPMDIKRNTGYRELPTTGKDLADLLNQLKQDASKKTPARKMLCDLITRATIASDECDFGTGLLLGLDIFTAGLCLEKEALQLLRVAYMLLHRDNFYKIASGHCEHRIGDDRNAYINSIVHFGSNARNEQSKQVTVRLPQPLVAMEK